MDKGNSFTVQWLGLGAFTPVAQGSIPGWGTKIWQAAQCSQKKKMDKGFQQTFLQRRYTNSGT